MIGDYLSHLTSICWSSEVLSLGGLFCSLPTKWSFSALFHFPSSPLLNHCVLDGIGTDASLMWMPMGGAERVYICPLTMVGKTCFPILLVLRSVCLVVGAVGSDPFSGDFLPIQVGSYLNRCTWWILYLTRCIIFEPLETPTAIYLETGMKVEIGLHFIIFYGEFIMVVAFQLLAIWVIYVISILVKLHFFFLYMVDV